MKSNDTITLNGQPLDKLCFNRDNFEKLKGGYREVLDLLIVEQAKKAKQATPAKKAPVKKVSK